MNLCGRASLCLVKLNFTQYLQSIQGVRKEDATNPQCPQLRFLRDSVKDIIHYYSTITSYYHTRARERARYESFLHCSKLAYCTVASQFEITH